MSNEFAARHPRLSELFGIDLRSLALFRFTLGLVLFIVLCRDFADLTAFYTDLGVMPRPWALEFDSFNRVSLYFLNGQRWFVFVLLAAQTIFALMFMLGWRTRLAAILSFVMWASLINRNSTILIGGDLLMSCLLFWAMFLPIGARYSVDVATSSNPPPAENRYLSWGTLAMLLQVASVAFFGALLKSGVEWYPQFTAAYYALSSDQFATPFGQWLLNFPNGMRTLSMLVWWLELLGPVLIFIPLFNRYLRLFLVVLFISMQLGFKLCLELGHFPFVSLASWTVFVGGWVWDTLDARLARSETNPLRIYYDRDCGFCLKSVLLIQQFLLLKRAQIAPAQDNARAKALLEANASWVVIDSTEQAHMKWPAFTVMLKHSPLLGWLWPLARASVLVNPGNALYDWVGRHRGGFGKLSDTLLPARAARYEVSEFWQRVAAVLMLAVLCWNLATANLLPKITLDILAMPIRMLRIDQIWNQFAPFPPKEDGWLVVPAKLADGTELDLLHPDQGVPDYGKPWHYSQTHRNIRWQTYLAHLTEPGYASQRVHYGEYLCREWNVDKFTNQSKRLMTFKLVYMLERTPPPGEQAQIEQIVLSRHECFPQETKGQVP